MAAGAESDSRQAYWTTRLGAFANPHGCRERPQENWHGTERFSRQQVDIDPGLTGQLQSAARNLT